MEKSDLTAAEWHERFLLQATWTGNLRNYLMNKLVLQPNSRILEVGCGTCAVLAEFTNKNIQSFGIDIDIDFLNYGHNKFHHLMLTQGDGISLPFPSDAFDLIYCHYLLLWADNPTSIMEEITRVGKPGAKVIILAEPDYGGRIDYPPPLQELGIKQTKALQLQGADPFIGRRIRELAISVGLTILEHGVLNSQSDMKFNQEYIDSEWQMLEQDLSNKLTTKEIQRFKQIDLDAWGHGIRVSFIPIFYLLAEIR